MGHFSALSGGVALAMIMLPVITLATAETLLMIPVNLREAALAPGVSSPRTIFKVVLPAGKITAFMGPSGCGKTTFMMRCINRMHELAPNAQVSGEVLLDEPTSALDPKATAAIEGLIVSLKGVVTIVQVTHNIPQAARISDVTAFIHLGEPVELGPTKRLFAVPKDPRTEEYLSGKSGWENACPNGRCAA